MPSKTDVIFKIMITNYHPYNFLDNVDPKQ